MANVFTNPQKVADRAIARFANQSTLIHLVSRDYDQDFAGKQGDTVVYRTPATFVAHKFDRAQGTIVQSINEGQKAIKMDTILDVTVGVTDEEMTLDIDSFDERVLTPMLQALVEDVEARLAALAVDVPQNLTGDVNDPAVLAEASAYLSTVNAPKTGRAALVVPSVYGKWITKEPFASADKSGSTDALRDAHLGRAYSFETYETNVNVGDVAPANDLGVAFHKNAFALITRTLEIPAGVAGAVANLDGIGIRITHGYDMSKKQQTVSADLLMAAEAVNPELAIVLPKA